MKKIFIILIIFLTLTTFFSCEKYDNIGITKFEDKSTIQADPYGDEWRVSASYSFSRTGSLSYSSFSDGASSYFFYTGSYYIGHIENVNFSTSLNLCTSPANFPNKSLNLSTNTNQETVYESSSPTGPFNNSHIIGSVTGSNYYTSSGIAAIVNLLHFTKVLQGWYWADCNWWKPCTKTALRLNYNYQAWDSKSTTGEGNQTFTIDFGVSGLSVSDLNVNLTITGGRGGIPNPYLSNLRIEGTCLKGYVVVENEPF